MRPTRRVLSDVHGHLDPGTVEDDETCVILSSTARLALLKLIERQSRSSLRGCGLTEDEARAAESFYHTLT